MVWLAMGIVMPARAADVFAGAGPFFKDNCVDCHDQDTFSGRLDLTTLEYHPEDGANFALWVKVHDRVQAGEMPPEKKKARPDPVKTRSFLAGMDAMLKDSERTLMAGEGRALERRLNRYEYENAVARFAASSVAGGQGSPATRR